MEGAFIGAGQSVAVSVAYRGSTGGGSGSITLTASDPSTGATLDAGSITTSVTAPSSAIVEVSSINQGATIDKSQCLTFALRPDVVTQCGVLRVTHSLPSVRTRNKVRTPTLVYYYDQAQGYYVLGVNVTLAPSAVPDSVRLTVFKRMSDGSLVNVSQKSRASSYWATSPRSERIGLGFPLDDYGPNTFYPYRVTTEFFQNGGWISAAPAVDGEIASVQHCATAFNCGWWLEGLEELTVGRSDGTIMWAGGDGSARKYVPDPAPSPVYRAVAVDRPDSLVRGGDGNYTRYLPHGARVVFDATGRHIQTIDRLNNVTSFTFTPGLHRLETINLPAPAGSMTYRFFYNAGDGRLDSISAPGLNGISRFVRITRSGSAVTRITDPDGSHVDFGRMPWQGGDPLISAYTDQRGILTQLDQEGYSPTVITASTTLAGGRIVQQWFRTARGLSASPDAAPVGVDQAYTQYTDPRNNVSKFWVDSLGAPLQVQDAAGQVSVVTHGDTRFAALATRVREPNGHVVSASFDDHGNLLSTYDRSPYGDARDAAAHYHWNRTWDFPDSLITAEQVVTHLVYDSRGNRQSQVTGTDPARTIYFAYYPSSHIANGLLQSTTLPGTTADLVTYDGDLANLSQYQTPKGFTTTYVADAIGRDTLVLSPIDSLKQYFRRDRTVYSVASRDSITQSIGPSLPTAPAETVTVRTYYDLAGNRDSLSRYSSPDPSLIGTITTRWHHDELGRVVAEIAPDGAKDSTHYDLAGNPDSLFTRRGPVVTMVYDQLNRLSVRYIPGVSYPSRFDGIPAIRGDLSPSSENPAYPRYANNGSNGYDISLDSAAFAYDAAGQVTKADNSDALVRRGYFPNGQIAAETAYVRKLSGTIDSTTHRYSISYQYDLDGRRTQLRHPSQLAPVVSGTTKDLTSYGYDVTSGQLSTVTDPLGYIFTYGYNTRGEVQSLTMPSVAHDQYTYDGDGNLTELDTYIGATQLRNTHMVYDGRGNVLQGRNAYGAMDTLSAAYSGLGHVVQSDIASYGVNGYSQAGRYSSTETFTLDGLANVAVKNSQQSNSFFNGSKTWSAGGESDYYKAAVGRLARQVSSGRVDTTMYDNAGNIEFTKQSGSSQNFYADRASYYDAENRLRAVDRRLVPVAGGTEFQSIFEEYRYDALGRRVWLRSRRFCNGSGIAKDECNLSYLRRTVWDGADELYEIQVPGENSSPDLENDTGVIQRQLSPNGLDPNPFFGRVGYTHGLTTDRPLGVTRINYSDLNTGGVYYKPAPFTIVPLWNRRGMPDLGYIAGGALTRCANSSQDNCILFDWPTAYAVYGAGDRIPLYFQGSLLEDKRDKTGTLYRRNRVYDPSTGRFTQEDPIRLAGGLNLYGFASGDPVNFSDPFGLCGKKEEEKCPQADLGPQVRAASQFVENVNNWFVLPLAFGMMSDLAAGEIGISSDAENKTIDVVHFTSAEGAGAIEGSGALREGTFVALPGEVAGKSAGAVESFLEIAPGRGAMNARFRVPVDALKTPFNGPTTSGGATQFQVTRAIPLKPGTFVPTP